MSSLLKKVGDSIQDFTSHFEFTFGIQNLGLLDEPGRIINSPDFEDTKYGEKWRVQFRHHSPDIALETLHLVHSKSKEEINSTFQICILDGSKNIKWAGPAKTEIFREGQEKQLLERFSISVVLDPIYGYFVDGSVYFYVQVLTRRLKSESSSKPKPEPESKNVMLPAEQLKSCLLNKNFADVTLTSGNSRFPACKTILAAQSPVFLAMFNSEMRESESNAVVKIEDFSDEIIKGFLEFLYTGQTGSLEENAGELLKISDKYQVMSLKGKCEQILLENLKIENAVDILVLAHLYSPENLKPKIISFVNKYYKDLKGTESFQRVAKEYPQLILDMYEALRAMN